MHNSDIPERQRKWLLLSNNLKIKRSTIFHDEKIVRTSRNFTVEKRNKFNFLLFLNKHNYYLYICIF